MVRYSGPCGIGVVSLDLAGKSKLLEHVTEIAVLILLFAAGLKLRQPWSDRR